VREVEARRSPSRLGHARRRSWAEAVTRSSSTPAISEGPKPGDHGSVIRQISSPTGPVALSDALEVPYL